MTSFQIKLLAAILMVIDHIGQVFFPNILAFKAIGRLSFPLFAWLIGQGEKYTHNFKIYLLRLIGLGLISQPFYYFLFQDYRPNILLTLALGLLAIRLDKITHLRLVFTCILALVAQLIQTDYGAYGVFLIVLLSYFDSKKIIAWVLWIFLNLGTPIVYSIHPIQLLAIFAPFILLTWNGQQGQKAKWFYWFYPLHLAVLLLIKQAGLFN